MEIKEIYFYHAKTWRKIAVALSEISFNMSDYMMWMISIPLIMLQLFYFFNIISYSTTTLLVFPIMIIYFNLHEIYLTLIYLTNVSRKNEFYNWNIINITINIFMCTICNMNGDILSGMYSFLVLMFNFFRFYLVTMITFLKIDIKPKYYYDQAITNMITVYLVSSIHFILHILLKLGLGDTTQMLFLPVYFVIFRMSAIDILSVFKSSTKKIHDKKILFPNELIIVLICNTVIIFMSRFILYEILISVIYMFSLISDIYYCQKVNKELQFNSRIIILNIIKLLFIFVFDFGYVTLTIDVITLIEYHQNKKLQNEFINSYYSIQ